VSFDGNQLILFVYFFVVLGLELKVFTLSHATSSIFVKGFSIGSHKLFSQAGFEL
jgi:hypothetical protein